MLWEALYLTRPEIEEFLLYVQQNATLPWVYPMMTFAAYKPGKLPVITVEK